MSLLGFIILILIAAVAGAIGQALGGFSFGGFLGAILVGFVGAFLGMWIAGQLGLPDFLSIVVDGRAFPIIWAIIGAAILSFVFSLLAGHRRRRSYR